MNPRPIDVIQDTLEPLGLVAVPARTHSNMSAALSAIAGGHGLWGLEAHAYKAIALAALATPSRSERKEKAE